MQKLHGQKLAEFDPRKHEMAERESLFMRPNASTDLIWASAA
ncbi:Formate dehydrogenase related protein [Halomonas citrativorans]|uniref:Formate dehydrogenase related protein n=1 Tax=Halomonas citrativorans TaxID=2742612 RepID=A0A1R4I104_9GAMM|nr:hypothetical protein [Halomonas citrativorans]SJN13537.1 Formate dehydrogenase related protein [Halomonas citrativorans]